MNKNRSETLPKEIFYKRLDEIIPGGTLKNLETSGIPHRKLYLTRISMDGLEDMHEYSQDDRLYKYLEFEPFKSKDETRAYLKKLIDRIGTDPNNRKHMYWFIRLVENHKIIGTIGLVDIDAARDSASWGYAISPAYWGQGYILEAQMIVISYFFDVLKMNRLWGVTAVNNEPTISSILGAGFHQEGILREYYKFADGQRQTGFIYSMLARDYQLLSRKRMLDQEKSILTLAKLKQIFAVVLKVAESSVRSDTSMADLANWDSLNHVVLISQIEKATGYKFKPIQIANATSVKSIMDMVNKNAT